MVSFQFLFLAAAFATVSAELLPKRHYYRRQDVPNDFRALNAAPADDIISLRFALAPRDFGGLEERLYAASTPGDEQYEQYLSKDEVNRACSLWWCITNLIMITVVQVNAYMVPSEETVNAVSSWFSTHGLAIYPLVGETGDWIMVNATVAQANELLQAEYTVFEK